MKINMEKLKKFLQEAKKSTYASGNSPKKREDGAKVFKFVNSDFEGFEYEDAYFGGERFAGQEIVKQNGILIWSMVYSGGIIKNILNKDILYNRFLKTFLLKMDNIPARGEDSQIGKNGHNKVIYHNPHTGKKDMQHFKGREFISYNGEIVYELFYSGGIIK
jgi:hypothetical protein